MNNMELYCKADKVMRSSTTKEQLKVAFEYIKLARRASSKESEVHYKEMLALCKEKYASAEFWGKVSW